MKPPAPFSASDALLKTVGNIIDEKQRRIRAAIKADLKKMLLAAGSTETAQALLAAAPPEAQEFIAKLIAEEEDR